MKREWTLFIKDIYDSVQYIKKFVGKMNRKEFLADEKTRSAVAFKIENILLAHLAGPCADRREDGRLDPEDERAGYSRS